MTTESKEAIDYAESQGRKYGWSVRKPVLMGVEEKKRRTKFTAKYANDGIWKLELTFGLKKAFPGKLNKEKRKNWPAD